MAGAESRADTDLLIILWRIYMDSCKMLKKTIAAILKTNEKNILDVRAAKKGMTNISYTFQYNHMYYIIRIPGIGSNNLINRKQECAVYECIKNSNTCDDLVYINAEDGYKITKFYHNARHCNPHDVKDVKRCITFLHDFHNQNLKVDHSFHLFQQINAYEKLRKNKPSIYSDYMQTKNNIFNLENYIKNNVENITLSHIDAVCDNFLFVSSSDSAEQIKLIDWEYSGMHDPHIDIAMFCIYSMYNQKQIDEIINFYFNGNVKENVRIKIYCYIAACGLLWSNWCEYKHSLGVNFGPYAVQQYLYAKKYYNLVAGRL